MSSEPYDRGLAWAESRMHLAPLPPSISAWDCVRRNGSLLRILPIWRAQLPLCVALVDDGDGAP